MQFDQFVREIDGVVRGTAAVERFAQPHGGSASWGTGSRSAEIALAPPQNVSVTLAGTSEPQNTTWYPIDPALVPVVSKRIAGYLGEA